MSQFPEALETERLVLRVARPGDGAVLNQAVVESIEQLSPWLPWAVPTPSVNDSEDACRKAYARFLLKEDLMLLIFLRDQPVLVGATGLHRVNWRLRQFEVGYWGRTQYGKAGLLTEAVRALSEHALVALDAVRVHIRVDDLNVPSWRLAERAGFKLEGVLRNEIQDGDGTFRNLRVYSRIPRDAISGAAH